MAAIGGLLVVLLITAYFILTKYYLPRYVEQTLMPLLTKRAGLKGFSGNIRRIGPTGADLGSLTIGAEDAPTLKVKSVRIDFSLNRLYSKQKLTITKAVFTQPELRCSLKASDLYTDKMPIRKFVTDLCQGLSPGAEDQVAVELSAVEVVDGKLLLTCNAKEFLIPYKMLITPVDGNWKKIMVKAVFEFSGGKVPLTAHFDTDKRQVEFGLEIDCAIKELVKTGKLLHLDTAPPVGNVGGTISGKMIGKAEFSPFQLTDYSFNGTLNNAMWIWRGINFSSYEHNAGLTLEGNAKGFDATISRFSLRSSFEAEAKEFSCIYRKEPVENFKISTRLRLSDKTLMPVENIRVTPIGKLMLERQIDGNYNPADESWEFTTKVLSGHHGDSDCAFKINNILTVAEIKNFSLTGKGRGITGKLDFSADVPLFSAAATGIKRELDQLSVKGEIGFTAGKDKLFNNIRLKSDVSFKQMIIADNVTTLHINDVQMESILIYEKQKDKSAIKYSAKGKAKRFQQSFRENQQRIDIKMPVFDVTINGNEDLNFLDNSSHLINVKASSFLWSNRNIKYECSEPTFVNNQPLPGLKKPAVIGSIGSFGRVGISSGKHKLEFWLGKFYLTPPEKGGETKLSLDFGKIAYSNGDDLNISTGSGNVHGEAVVDTMLAGMPDKVMLNTATSNVDIKYFKNILKLDEAKIQAGLEFDPTMDAIDGLKLVDLKVKSDNFTGNRNKNVLEAKNFTASSLIKLKPNAGSGASLISASTKTNITKPTVEGEKLLCEARTLAISHLVQRVTGNKLRNAVDIDFIKASINSHDIALSGANGSLYYEINGDKLPTGKIELKKADLSLPKYELKLKQLSLKTPFVWPLANSNSDGTFKADVEWRKYGLGNGNFDISIRDRALLLRGVFSKFPAPGGRGLCFGRARLSSDESFKLEMDLSVPEQNLTKPFNCGLYYPELDGISISGKARASFSIEADADGINKREATLSLNEADLDLYSYRFKKVSTKCKFDDFLKLHSKAHLQLNFGELNFGPLSLQKGSGKYQLILPGGIDIYDCQAQWMNAKTELKPFKLDDSKQFELSLSCKGLSSKDLLEFLGFTLPECNAKFNGSFDFSGKNGKYLYSSARFQSPPGSDYVLKLPGLQHLAPAAQTVSSEALAAAALADFKPNWIKIDFSGPIKNAFNIHISTNGRPAAPLPFIPASGGVYLKASSDAANAVSGEMDIQLGLTKTVKK